MEKEMKNGKEIGKENGKEKENGENGNLTIIG